MRKKKGLNLVAILLSLAFILSACGEKSTAGVDPIYKEYFGEPAAKVLTAYISDKETTVTEKGVKITVGKIISDKHLSYALISVESDGSKEIESLSASFDSNYPNAEDWKLASGGSEIVWSNEKNPDGKTYRYLVQTHMQKCQESRKMAAEIRVKYKDEADTQTISIPFEISFKDLCTMKVGKDLDGAFDPVEVSPLGIWIETHFAESDEHVVVLNMKDGTEKPLEMDQYNPGTMYKFFYDESDISQISAVVVDGVKIEVK